MSIIQICLIFYLNNFGKSMIYLRIIFIIFFISTNILTAQNGAFNTSNLQQSPLLIGAGQIGASIPNDDVLGFYYNPAILGHSSRNNHASFSFMPAQTEWYSSQKTFNNYGLNLGYNFDPSVSKLPLSIGLGYLHNSFFFGEYNIYDPNTSEFIEKSKSYDEFDCFSIGAEIEYYLKFAVGFSLKSFNSNLGSAYINGELKPYSSKGTMFDYGILVTLPVSNLYFPNCAIELNDEINLKPLFNISLGNSFLNFGDEISYFDEFQKDPLARTSRLGYTVEFGFDLNLKEVKIPLINYSFTAEAEDLLLTEQNENNSVSSYQAINSDVNFIKHLIKLNPDNNIVVHKGHIFTFLNSFIYTVGSFQGRGYNTARKSDGIGFTTNGIFGLINTISINSTINYITKHFEIYYFDSNLFSENFDFGNTILNFDGISISFKNFEL